jgi:DNA-binding NarL/FixJ family response regulator
MESEYSDGPRIDLMLAAIFLLVVVGGTIDLILDNPPTLFSLHVGFEVLMVVLSLGAAAYLGRGWYSAQSRLSATEKKSVQLRREREEWQDRAADLLRGLSSEISGQFQGWALTPTEARVALMLLKGLSHKGIARSTDTSERTVRQHSVAVYRKSGLAGRAQLAGFFLEALLLPEEMQPSESA